jgi:hypothetical protein
MPERLRLFGPDVQDQQCPQMPASEANSLMVDDPFDDPDFNIDEYVAQIPIRSL